MTRNEYWESMRQELMGHTLKQLKAIARDENICLGYAAYQKETCVGEIVSQRRHRAEGGIVQERQHPWRELRSAKGQA